MSPYRAQYTESESDIKHYNFLYQKHQQVKTLSTFLKKKRKFSKIQNVQKLIFYVVLCIRSIIHFLLSFLNFGNFQKPKILQNSIFYLVLCIRSIIHIFIIFIIFIFIYIFIYLYIFLYIYIYSYIFIYLYIYIIN